MQNPINLIDPTGMSAEEGDWHPDENGNLVADKGDDAITLSEYMGISVDDAQSLIGTSANWDDGTNKAIVDIEGHTLNVGACGNTEANDDSVKNEEKTNSGSFNIDNAVNWLNINAHKSWKDADGRCAAYIRQSLEAGGLNTKGHPVPAWEYATFLPKLGFDSVNTTNYKKGDIAVFKGYPGGTADPKTGIPYGHIQMYSGNKWISDFKQDRPFWPSGKYERYQPAFQIFRRKK